MARTWTSRVVRSATRQSKLRSHAEQRNAALSGLLARQRQPLPPSVPQIARAPLPVSQVEKTREWQRVYMDGPIPADVPTTAVDGRPRDELSRRQFNGRFTVKRPTAAQEAQIVEAATRIFGRPTSIEDVSRLSGAPDGATVEVLLLPGRIPKLDIHVDHPLYAGTSKRTIKGSTKGPIIHNDVLKLQKDAPKGFGTRILAAQVRAAQALGVVTIETVAGGTPAGAKQGRMNGYYTWARLGYSGRLTPELTAAAREADIALPKRATIHDLFATDEGREWWRKHGDEMYMEFDPAPGSRSMSRLNDNLDEKEIVL